MPKDKLSAIILAKAKDAGMGSEEEEQEPSASDMGLESASQDLIAAMKSGSPKQVAEALKAAISVVMNSSED